MFRLLEQLYRAHLAEGQEPRAARCAFWLGMRLLAISESGRAGGWLSRATGLAERSDCVERGYLVIPSIYRHLESGDFQTAEAAATAALDLAKRFGDAELLALVQVLAGITLLRQGRVQDGLARLDEAMVALSAGELNPVVTGLVYCNALAGCQEVYAIARSREWTAAFATWCDSQSDLVPFTGVCRIHRAELLQVGGAWPEALAEARRAEALIGRSGEIGTVADSTYQQAEVLRLRGEFEAAEAAYRRASQQGRDPQPGLALLRLAQGRAAEAARAIRSALAATSLRLQRARFLPAFVEILIAADHLDEARQGVSELADIARDFPTDVLGAMAAHAHGALALAEGRAEQALGPLRVALRTWLGVGAPYIAARVRILCAVACRALGDHDTAERERELAAETFVGLGAATDLAGLDPKRPSAGVGGTLSARELEVIRLVATGKTNKEIARQLFLSQKTIDRHVSNIFRKIDVTTRAAATTYAWKHALL